MVVSGMCVTELSGICQFIVLLTVVIYIGKFLHCMVNLSTDGH